MSDSDLLHRPVPKDQNSEEQSSEHSVEPEDVLAPPLADPFGRIAPPAQISAQVTVLEGLQNLGYPSRSVDEQLAEIREELTGLLTVVDQESGLAIYSDPEWGDITGKMIEKTNGDQFFVAENSLIDASVESIGKGAIILSGTYLGPEVAIGEDALIGVGTQLRGNIVIGSNCKILSGARICGGALDTQDLEVGDRTTIGAESRLGPGNSPGPFKLVIGKDVHIGERTSIKGSGVIGDSVTIGTNCAIERTSVKAGVAIGKNCTLRGDKLPQGIVVEDIDDFSFIA